MSIELNILTIDTQIYDNFTDEKNKLSEYKEQLNTLEQSLKLQNLKPRVIQSLLNSKKNLLEHIYDIENNISFNFYVTETAEIIEKYKEILNSPIKINFMGKISKNNDEKE